MKKVIFLVASILAMNSYANVSKCAEFVVGLQSSDVKTVGEIGEFVESFGLTSDEMTECKAHINSSSEVLKKAVFDIIPEGVFGG